MNPSELIPGREYRHRTTKRVMVFIRREEVGAIARNFFRCPAYAGQRGPDDQGIIYAYDAEVETTFEPARQAPAPRVKRPRLYPSQLVVGRIYRFRACERRTVEFLGHNGSETAWLRAYRWRLVETGQEFSNFEKDFRAIQEVK